jgi:hypothetical protein
VVKEREIQHKPMTDRMQYVTRFDIMGKPRVPTNPLLADKGQGGGAVNCWCLNPAGRTMTCSCWALRGGGQAHGEV